ncbi:ATP pump family protein protein ENTH domain epsin related family protein [Acanthamoeba castellanii str. Neff]|uniref:ATP pump family proteinprotein ENTH domain epsin related family protein n=1 Tax=Acanthamoeba castellanii (strain ATCC 30010 / Neff) TaxID=1257118 RepID=L8GF71_ACACF|nr:ATP pump family protein protein ENTH domain epsin related family protein [Acanthamoeba castellanii str. Neff]ELR11388.1 ATP pump family proteinprotein ENTH domain epsin related family protein [Acanthamoeba castellanii str. Neff]
MALAAQAGDSVGAVPLAPKYRGMLHAGATIVREEGALSLWKGIAPALLRQFLYTGLRMGIYEPIRNFFAFGGTKASDAPLLTKILAGMVAGGVSAAVFTPTDLLKVRMQGSSGQRYRSLLHAIKTVVAEEKISGLWKGMGPTSQRAAVVAAAELATYDQCKQFLLGNNIMQDNIYTHFAASFIAGFVATASSFRPIISIVDADSTNRSDVHIPTDVVKTRVMNQPSDANGRGLYYRSSLDCARKLVAAEGVRGFYRGFLPNWIRLGPWNIIMFLTYEQLRRVVEKH